MNHTQEAFERKWLSHHEPAGDEVFILITTTQTGMDVELFSKRPTFPLAHNQTLRVGNINGGDSEVIA